jgi:radical SAM superfamily enzyme YgiQ (UPF0313 family)
MYGLTADAADRIYDYMDSPPALPGEPYGSLPKAAFNQCLSSVAVFDAGRGCPFKCSFCTVVSVYGQGMRSRSVQDIEQIIRNYYKRGTRHFFITDDDFARNPNWEPILDRLIELRQTQGLKLSLTIQIDTAAYRIPRFADKIAAAGTIWLFISVESLNPANLAAANKRHNRVDGYRDMIKAWHDRRVLDTCNTNTGS